MLFTNVLWASDKGGITLERKPNPEAGRSEATAASALRTDNTLPLHDHLVFWTQFKSSPWEIPKHCGRVPFIFYFVDF